MNKGARVWRSDTDEENRGTVKHVTVVYRPQESPEWSGIKPGRLTALSMALCSMIL